MNRKEWLLSKVLNITRVYIWAEVLELSRLKVLSTKGKAKTMGEVMSIC